MSRWITCPECGGTGNSYQYDEDDEEVLDKCWVCDGVGEVKDEIESITNSVNGTKIWH